MTPIQVTLKGTGVSGKVLELRRGRYWIDGKQLSDAWGAMVDGTVLLSCEPWAAIHLSILLDRYIGDEANTSPSSVKGFILAIRDEYEWCG